MAVKNVHHVGIAVNDLDASVLVYEELFGARLEHRESVEEQGVEAASLHVGEGRIELLRPLQPDTPVGRFLAKRGPGMHHVAFRVDDVGEELARLRVEGAKLIDESPRRGLFGLQVAFVHPEATGGVLAEFVSDE
jgi:methylmalonyl-CoA epimerase